MELLGSCDGNVAALLSAHQSIGVPQPHQALRHRGAEAALPAALRARARSRPSRSPRPTSAPTRRASRPPPSSTADGTQLHPQRQQALVHQRHPRRAARRHGRGAHPPNAGRSRAFVVEANSPGVKVEHRCRFMGLRALANGVIRSRRPRAAREPDRQEGQGLKIALTTLNTGAPGDSRRRSAGIAKLCLEICRDWAGRAGAVGPAGRQARGDRPQARRHGGDHLRHGVGLRPRPARWPTAGGYDIRLEAAAAKLWNTDRAWRDRRRHRCRSAAAAATRPRSRSRRAARRRSPSSSSCATSASTGSSRARARSCTCSWRARRSTSTSRSPAT